MRHNSFLNQFKKNAVVLSVGCGPGIIEKRMQEIRKDLYIISLDVNRNMLSTFLFFLNLIHGDGQCVPFTSESFNAALCITSLEFMVNPERTIKETYRILKNHGLFMALFLNPKSRYIQQKTLNSIQGSVIRLFDKMETQADLFIENNEIVEQPSNDTARLIIMKAIK